MPEARSSGPSGAGLENHTDVASGSRDSGAKSRRRKWDRLEFQRAESALIRQRRCLSQPIDRLGYVVAGVAPSGAHRLGGVMTCGLRSCTNCGPRIAAQRREEIAGILRWAGSAGYRSVLVTLTLGHTREQSLDFLYDQIMTVWRDMTRRSDYRALRTEFGAKHYVRVVETTHGLANGWHPHFHVVFLLKEGADPAKLGQNLYPLWAAAAARIGAKSDAQAFDAHLVDESAADTLAGYVAKQSEDDLAWEMTGGDGKTGAGRSPGLLLSLGMADDGWALALHNEFELAQANRQTISFSRGLVELAGVRVVIDEDAAAAPDDEDDWPTERVVMTAPTWSRFVRRNPGKRGVLFDVIERHGVAAAVAWLADLGSHAWLSDFEPMPRASADE